MYLFISYTLLLKLVDRHQTLDAIYTRHHLNQTPFTLDTIYTRHHLHQTSFTPDSIYTKNYLHQTPFTYFKQKQRKPFIDNGGPLIILPQSSLLFQFCFKIKIIQCISQSCKIERRVSNNFMCICCCYKANHFTSCLQINS